MDLLENFVLPVVFLGGSEAQTDFTAFFKTLVIIGIREIIERRQIILGGIFISK